MNASTACSCCAEIPEDMEHVDLPGVTWRRLAVAGAFATASGIVEMTGAWGLWTAAGSGAPEWLSGILAIIAIYISGLTTYRKGWLAIAQGRLNINALMSVAVTGAIIIGQCPEAAMVMTLFNLAEVMEAKSLDRARNAVRKLLDLAPETAAVQSGGAWVETDARHVPAGSLVRVRPGERVALDGIVLSGRSAVNQAPITGESMPVEKNAGDIVHAGSINTSGSFEFRVTNGFAGSMPAKIARVVEEAQGKRAPIQNVVDAFSRIYTPAVFLAALFTAAVPPLFMSGVWSEWAYTALVVLVMGCPCALVISTPVTIVCGMASAARSGILVKGGVFFEQGRKLRCLALDKTGTITSGKARQTDCALLNDNGNVDALAVAMGLAVRSDHPVSAAIAESAAEKGVIPLEATDFTELPGRGTSGMIGGAKWFLGNYRLVEELGFCSGRLEKRVADLEKHGKSVVILMGDAGPQCLFAATDGMKRGSAEAVEELHRLGIQTIMLTGDNEHAARAIAAQAGVGDFRGRLMPEEKLAIIGQLARNGVTGMAGDGINDAPALAGADISFAMAAAGTDTAIETADVALMDDDLRKIPRFVRLSRAVYAIIMQNIILALGVKAFFFALTFTGQATMWMAVFADAGVSLLVVANGLRALRK